MLDREKIVFETSSTAVVDLHYSSFDCNDESYFLRWYWTNEQTNEFILVTALVK